MHRFGLPKLFGLVVLAFSFLVINASAAFAQGPLGTPQGCEANDGRWVNNMCTFEPVSEDSEPPEILRDEDGFESGQSGLGGVRDTEQCDAQLNGQECLQNLRIFEVLGLILEFMAIITIPIITIIVVIGGVQYSLATGDPGKVSAAKARIMNGVIALASFVFLWSFLQWLVPGGVF